MRAPRTRRHLYGHAHTHVHTCTPPLACAYIGGYINIEAENVESSAAVPAYDPISHIRALVLFPQWDLTPPKPCLTLSAFHSRTCLSFLPRLRGPSLALPRPLQPSRYLPPPPAPPAPSLCPVLGGTSARLGEL
jgi:hypothetical protein